MKYSDIILPIGKSNKNAINLIVQTIKVILQTLK